MTPALARAAAFLYLTGERPRGIHLHTAAALRDVAPYTPDVRRVAGVSVGGYVLSPDYLDEVRAHPFSIAGDVLREAAGARLDSGASHYRLTSHYASFVGDGWQGLAFRDGGGSARFDLDRIAAPFNRGAGFSHATAAAFLACYRRRGSGPVAWCAWRDLARELTAARYSDEADAYSEREAMRWHGAGRDPFAYALDAHRATVRR